MHMFNVSTLYRQSIKLLHQKLWYEPNSFMHMFNVSTLYRQSIKLLHQKLWYELIGPCMAYNSISIKPYIKSHLELQREITLIELAPSPYFFVESICLAYMNMFARFDENLAMNLQDIKKKRYGRTNALTHNVKTVYRINFAKSLYPLFSLEKKGILILYQSLSVIPLSFCLSLFL